MPEVKQNKLLKFLLYFTGPISYLLEAAVIITGALGEWIDFGILVFVLITNAVIGFHEEAKAESALDALKNTLALKTRCWRNGLLVEVEAGGLVPGDVVGLRLGDIVPADIRLLGVGINGEITEGQLQIDQSGLTGESLPVAKGKGATAYSSSIVKQGAMLGIVVKTGVHTYIGRAANLISITDDEGHFQKIIKIIGNFLVALTIGMALIIFLVQIFAQKMSPLNSLKQVVIITIAAIPVGLPTVMSVTMALGAKELAKKQVIVKRLTAIEELASVSILCSDKTGTLTMNKLSTDKPYLRNIGNTAEDEKGSGVAYTEEELLVYAYLSSEPGTTDAIESCIRRTAETKVESIKTRAKVTDNIPGYRITSFTPFNPVVKHTEAIVVEAKNNFTRKVIKGAPQVIIALCGNDPKASQVVNEYAARGLRCLGVAVTVDSKMQIFEMVGMISLLDPPRPDSAKTIQECISLGVNVKMITGDQLVIAKEVAMRLGMDRCILDAQKLVDTTISDEQMAERVVKADGFAHVIPEHKFRVVELLQSRGCLVGMTGDGVNDAPALKKANVGIAVEGCTDAARSASDIVLLAEGLSTIIDGIKTSRAIFQRMRSYALYRISSTVHFLLFFFISILWFQFALPDLLIIAIAVLNDAATLVIAVDNARISKRPDKWRVGQLLFLSFILGFLLMLISFAHFALAKAWYPFTVPPEGFPEKETPSPGTEFYNYRFVQTIMYLQISSCPHFVIFSTRLSTWWWKSMPSMTFLTAIIGTQIIAGVITVCGPEWLQTVPIGWAWTWAVLGVSGVMFMLLDIVKVVTFKIWSFELTAKLWPSKSNRNKLLKREQEKLDSVRIEANVKKVKRAFTVLRAMNAWLHVAKVKSPKA